MFLSVLIIRLLVCIDTTILLAIVTFINVVDILEEIFNWSRDLVCNVEEILFHIPVNIIIHVISDHDIIGPQVMMNDR